jgi:hypothetical protein
MMEEEELGGLILTCIIALVATEALRQLIMFCMMLYKKDPSCVDALVFPRWHLIVFQAQFLGLAQSAGAAMGSPCPGYVAFGVRFHQSKPFLLISCNKYNPHPLNRHGKPSFLLS